MARPVFDPQVPKEAVRDFRPLASVDAMEVQAARQPLAHPRLPLVVPPMVAAAFRYRTLAHCRAQLLVQNVAQEFPPQAAAPEPLPEPKLEPQVAHSVQSDESESEQARSLEAH